MNDWVDNFSEKTNLAFIVKQQTQQHSRKYCSGQSNESVSMCNLEKKYKFYKSFLKLETIIRDI